MRLTKKYDDNSGYEAKENYAYEQHLYIDLGAYENCVQKLGQLEDIEEELGIDLITFFKIYNSTHIYMNRKKYSSISEYKICQFCKHGSLSDYRQTRHWSWRGRHPQNP